MINTKYYREIYANLLHHCPIQPEDVIKCVPRYEHGIRVYLKNGDCVDFDNREKSFRIITKNRLEKADDLSDETCKEIFARNLSDIMRNRNIRQEMLSDYTGISQSMLSRYLNRRSTPTLTNLKRIARALNCTIHELTEM